MHRDHGVAERRQLARLDHRTARLVADKVDLRPLLDALDERTDDTPVAAIIGARRTAHLARLEAEIKAFVDDEWVDLLAVFRRQLLTGSAVGLKSVAHHASSPGKSKTPAAASR